MNKSTILHIIIHDDNTQNCNYMSKWHIISVFGNPPQFSQISQFMLSGEPLSFSEKLCSLEYVAWYFSLKQCGEPTCKWTSIANQRAMLAWLQKKIINWEKTHYSVERNAWWTTVFWRSKTSSGRNFTKQPPGKWTVDPSSQHVDGYLFITAHFNEYFLFSRFVQSCPL